MLRRLAETLIIEAYETLGREKEIKYQDDNFLMVGALVDRSCGANGIGLGREAKAALKKLRNRATAPRTIDESTQCVRNWNGSAPELEPRSKS
jgi:hypothetical protein